MTDRLWLDPAQAEHGVQNLTAAGHHLRGLCAVQGGDIAHASGDRPWGKDDIGAAFEKNYRPIEQQVLQAMNQLAVYIGELSVAAGGSVTDNLEADERGNVRMSATRRQLP